MDKKCKCTNVTNYDGKYMCIQCGKKFVAVDLIKPLVVLYFEGCAADTFDDAMRELEKLIT